MLNYGACMTTWKTDIYLYFLFRTYEPKTFFFSLLRYFNIREEKSTIKPQNFRYIYIYIYINISRNVEIHIIFCKVILTSQTTSADYEILTGPTPLSAWLYAEHNKNANMFYGVSLKIGFHD